MSGSIIGNQIFNKTSAILEESLNLRMQRHMVNLSNVTNSMTPGYRALGIDFEKQLQAAVGDPEQIMMKTSDPRHIKNPGISADGFLKRIEEDEVRKTEGLTDRSLSALKELSIAPYHNKIALSVLMDEVKSGRYEERTLSTLSEWSKELRGKPQAELIYEKILAYPTKSSDEVQIVETSIMQFADDLREAGRFSKAGDMFFAVSNLTQGTRRAEAAYKAGVVYARAGLFDKAKTAWLLAANDTNDKRYSSLANERLDRISK